MITSFAAPSEHFSDTLYIFEILSSSWQYSRFKINKIEISLEKVHDERY